MKYTIDYAKHKKSEMKLKSKKSDPTKVMRNVSGNLFSRIEQVKTSSGLVFAKVFYYLLNEKNKFVKISDKEAKQIKDSHQENQAERELN